ncbi:MAG: O-antigen ligase family protein [Cytophagales bacterium]|nr:O-antigen ligase family protein [Cytophagales bacterium]
MIINNKYTHYLFLVLFISLPISKGLASTCEVLLIFLSLLRLKDINIKYLIKENKHVVSICLIFLCFLVGLLYTSDLVNGLIVLKRHHRLFVIPFIVLLNPGLIEKYGRQYILAFIQGTAFACLVTIIFYLIPEAQLIKLINNIPLLQEYPLNKDRILFGLYSPFIDRLQFSNLIAVASISSCYLFFAELPLWSKQTRLPKPWRRQANKKRIYILFLFLTLIITSSLLGGRGGQLGLLAGLMVFFICLFYNYLQPKLMKRIGKFFASSLFMLIIIFFAVSIPYCAYKFIPPVHKRYNQLFWELEVSKNLKKDDERIRDFTSVRRIVSWKNTWQLIKQNPVLGVGTGDYIYELSKIYEKDQYDLPVNSHSQYLYIWASIGIWGLIVFILVIFYWLYSLRNAQIIFIYGLSFLSFYLTTMLFDASLIKQIDSMTFSLFMSFIGILGNKK